MLRSMDAAILAVSRSVGVVAVDAVVAWRPGVEEPHAPSRPAHADAAASKTKARGLEEGDVEFPPPVSGRMDGKPIAAAAQGRNGQPR